MALLSDDEKKEMKKLSQSVSFKKDMGCITDTRYNPFIVKGKVAVDNFIIFLNEFNQFINHNTTFHKIIDKDMRL